MKKRILIVSETFYSPELGKVIYAGHNEIKTDREYKIISAKAVPAGLPEPEKSIDDMTMRELRRIASEEGISNYTKLAKQELIDAIKGARGEIKKESFGSAVEVTEDPLAEQELAINVEAAE